MKTFWQKFHKDRTITWKMRLNKLAFSDQNTHDLLNTPLHSNGKLCVSTRAMNLGEDLTVPSVCLTSALQGHPVVMLAVGDDPNCISHADYLSMLIPAFITRHQNCWCAICTQTPHIGIRVTRMFCGGAEQPTLSFQAWQVESAMWNVLSGN